MEIQSGVCKVKLRIVHFLAPGRDGLDARGHGLACAGRALPQIDIQLFIEYLGKIVADYFLTTEG
jgi:hypothetical protein